MVVILNDFLLNNSFKWFIIYINISFLTIVYSAMIIFAFLQLLDQKKGKALESF